MAISSFDIAAAPRFDFFTGAFFFAVGFFVAVLGSPETTARPGADAVEGIFAAFVGAGREGNFAGALATAGAIGFDDPFRAALSTSIVFLVDFFPIFFFFLAVNGATV